MERKLIYSHLSETLDYVDVHTQGRKLDNYLQLVREAKSKISIPIIASINCVSDTQWTEFATDIENAGADALELNISMNPLDVKNQKKEFTVIKIIKKILKATKIPVAVKISDRYSNLSGTITELGASGISGLVLFNRFFSPDIDIYNFSLVQGRMHSCDSEYIRPLRWIALMSDKVECSLAASSGIHDGNTVVKMLLAGADVVQIVSTLYLNGKDYIIQLLSDIEKWMLEKGIFSISQFKGMASYKKSGDPFLYERVQFMKYFGRIGR